MLVANHASFLDPVAVGVASSRGLTYFAREQLFRVHFFSKLLRAVNAIPINRKKLELSVIHRIFRLVDENKAFVIFPEGTRSRNGEMQRGKPGAGLIAWKTKVKVVPVLVQGTFKALPAGAKFIYPAKIKIFIGKPLVLDEFYSQTASKELYQKITDKMMSAIKALEH